MITDESIERALDWLRDKAPVIAQARANRIYAEEYRKTMKATIMAEHKDKPIGAQEREAYAAPRYVEHLEAIREAVREDEEMRWTMTAAEARIEAWRSMQANERAKGRMV